MNQVKRTLERVQNFRYILIFEGMAVGAFAGLIIVLFRVGINQAEKYMSIVRQMASNSIGMLAVFFAMILVFALICGWLVKKESFISGSGIPQVKGEMAEQLETKWYRVLAYKFLGAVIAIGSGLSLGREGPSIQLGAMAGKGFSRMTNKLRTEEKLLMTAGASAGLAAAFNAPLAGVMFSLEELHKNFSEEVLLCTMSAAITADFVAGHVFGLSPIFYIAAIEALPLKHFALVIILGILLGCMGVFYNYSIKKAQDFYGLINNKMVRIVIPFVLAGIIGFVFPEVLGGGSHLVEAVGAHRYVLDGLVVLFVIKFIFSIISFGSGAPGGIFLPLLVMGAVLGGTFFESAALFIDIDAYFLGNFVIFGMAGFFAAIVRAPITGIILISEMTGSLSNLLTLSVVSFTAYVVADLLNGKPIYNQLLERILSNQGVEEDKEAITKKNKVLIESPVYLGSLADGMKVSELSLPKGTLIVSITRGEKEIVPHGNTEIHGGDKIVVLINSDKTAEVDAKLEKLCRKMER